MFVMIWDSFRNSKADLVSENNVKVALDVIRHAFAYARQTKHATVVIASLKLASSLRHRNAAVCICTTGKPWLLVVNDPLKPPLPPHHFFCCRLCIIY